MFRGWEKVLKEQYILKFDYLNNFRGVWDS
jgi:hypothetical protein